MEMAMEMEMETEMEMVMVIVMVIFGARKARSELRFASKWVLTSDFEVLEASGALKVDQESPKKLPRSPQEAPEESSRGSQEASWRCFKSSWRSNKLPKPRSSIHSSFQGLQEHNPLQIIGQGITRQAFW